MSRLEIAGLTVGLPGGGTVLRGVDLFVGEGFRTGVVGESGAGKTMLLRSVLGQLPDGVRQIAGEIRLGGLQRIAHLPQATAQALHPTIRIARQIADVVRSHRTADAREARAESRSLLAAVGLPARVADAYPHQLSGGMVQRAVLATVLAARPRLLLADEPTAALDAVTRNEISDLLTGLCDRFGTTLLLVSHDIALVARSCGEVSVLYAGKVVEHGPARRVLRAPRHPYTVALVAALPDPQRPRPRLAELPGAMPAPDGRTGGCPFAARCPLVRSICAEEPPLVNGVACHVVSP